MPATSTSQAQSTPHAPLASLAAHWHACRGDIPPPLVGASVTLVDDPNPTKSRLYLFGGRLVTTRRMMNDLYELNMSTLRWKRLFASSEEEEDIPDGQLTAGSSSSSSSTKPQPRYFHSCNLWEEKLIIFGGMGYVDGNESELCVLNEIVAFDLKTYTWQFDIVSNSSHENAQNFIPQPRYAHLSSTTVDSLIIIGGQDMANRYVEEINVLDLKQNRWIQRQPYEKQRGSYRSLAVEPLWKVEEASTFPHSPTNTRESSDGQIEQNSISSSKQNPFLSAQNISTLPTSYREWTPNGKLKPLPVYVYTNYNFTDVKREMEVVSLESDDEHDDGTGTCNIQIEDQSQAMSGISLPPGLRFPMGAILGSHMLISGTYLANTSQTFAIWALHLPTMTWNRLDVGPLLSTGSWNRGVLWPLQNRLVVFGHRERDLVADYNHRQTNWDHVLLIELEAWGITQPPVKQMSLASIQMGLQKLASSTVGSYSASMESGIGPLDEEGDPILSIGGRGDFEIVCSDGMRLGCDRIILEKRWPWFATKMREYQRKAKQVAKNGSISKTSATKKGSRPNTAGEQLSALLEEDENGTLTASSTLATSADPRITPRELHISEPSPVMLALLTFIYTQCVCTQLQQHPAIVAALLIVSKVYDMKDLEVWAKHTAHVVMSRDLAPRSPGAPSIAAGMGSMGQGGIPGSMSMSRRSSLQSSGIGAGALPPLERHRLAVALYEAATMSGFEALQIRSLRTVMSIAKWVQRSSISSARSSATQESSAEVPGANMPTPTTAAMGGGMGEQIPRTPEGEKTFNLRSGASSIASPSISRKGSIGKSTISESSETGKKTSRIEKSLGMSGLENPQAGDSAPQLSSTSNLSSGALSKTSTQSSQTSTSTTGQAVPSANVSQRRPSALSTNGNSTVSRPPPSSSANATSGRKRFSIFGRGSETSGNKSGSSALTPTTPLEGHQEENGRSSNESPTYSRLQRTNTEGSGQGTPGTDSVSNHSMTSLNATQGSVGQNSISSSTGTLGKEEGHTSNVSKLASAFENGATISAPRKSSTFGSRLRSVTGQGGSNSGMSTSKSGNSLHEDPIAEAKVITPTLASTKQMSNVAAGLPSPSLSSGGASSIQTTTSSTKTASGGGGSSGNRKRMDAGQLNPKDIKALHGIFA